MGAKDSKPSFITYEDAVKRVSDSESRRIREAFKRCAGANGTALSLETFVREVLCEGVPYEVAEWLYQACGGTKRGIAYKELLCGIVVLTKGTLEEKIKFLWTLYVNNQNDNGTYMYRRDFTNALHFENASLPVTGAERTAEILTSLFGSGDKVTFEQFRSWLLIHKDATVLSKWLLSERTNTVQDLETPTFYQSLAGVTHLEERDIIELEKCFWSLRNTAPTGQLDLESLTPLLSPPLPRAAVAGTFSAFDENRDGHVDFKELCCGLSAACRGPRAERLKFCFKIFDVDRDGMLNKKELSDMLSVLCTVANESIKNSSRASTPSEGTEWSSEGSTRFEPAAVLGNLRAKLVTAPAAGRTPVFQLGPDAGGAQPADTNLTEIPLEMDAIAEDTVLTLEDFLIWSVESADALVTPFLELVFEVCHIVLGLRPQCRHRERDIVMGWVRREVSRGYSVGQFWYLVGAEWWAAWQAYCGAPGGCCRPAPPPAPPSAPRLHDDVIATDDSFTSNSTESMGSLLWRAETASVGSAGSSSGVSSAAAQRTLHPGHPGPVDNKRLLAPNLLKVRTLTGEGGHLRRDVTLAQHRDFELVPDALWRALALWYGGPDPLPRQVIRPPNSDVELELYPLHLKLLRHVASPQRLSIVGVGAGAGVSAYSSVPLAPAAAPPERQLAYTAAFSRLATVRQVSEFVCGALGLAREDMRLWSLGGSALLLDDERPTLHELRLGERLGERGRLLVEVRNQDLTWPEEIGALSMCGGSGRGSERRETLIAPNLPGATGLHNLGNTCFMNAALQSVWNTGPLTRYFNSGMHLYEVNPTNPLGTKGALALRYGELCKEVWSMSARSVAPLRVRWCVSRHARQLAGGGQHDAQELLAWLLDTLHEDLNRAPPRPHPPPPHRDSAGRPDQEVAAEAWEAYTQRNKSIITDLFYGQLKSKVRCDECGQDSVRFDAFNMLSLPLPMESYVRAEVRVMLLDGSVPVKYGVRVNSEGTYLDLKKALGGLCGLSPAAMLLVELNGACIGRVFEDHVKISHVGATSLYAYEVPPPDADSDLSDDELHAEMEGAEAKSGGSDAGGGGPDAEVSVGRSASSLCMPALFCFKRSASEALMSQSPPDTFAAPAPAHALAPPAARNGYRATTLPRDHLHLKRSAGSGGGASPTLSVRSLSLRGAGGAGGASPRPLRAAFSSSPADMSRLAGAPLHNLYSPPVHYLHAVHRKQCRADAYFLPSQRCKPALFGVPLLVGLRDGMSGREIYAQVWTQVMRLLSARPPQNDQANHATDCDDSLGYEYPFTLRLVAGGGARCGLCAWPASCRGCALPNDTAPLVYSAHGNTPRPRKRSSVSRTTIDSGVPDCNSPIVRTKLQHQHSRLASGDDDPPPGVLQRLDLSLLRAMYRRVRAQVMLAIDWDPTALHLRYQSTREKAWTEHASVAECSWEAARPVDLASCLSAFTSEERLEERYHCATCRSAQPATKKLQIWRAPPILIIHLKRFQYVNNKWIKSQKVVNFPFSDFDPTQYLAAVPQETIVRYKEISHRRSVLCDSSTEPISESDESEDETSSEPQTKEAQPNSRKRGERDERVERGERCSRRRRSSCEARTRQRLQSSSLAATPVTDDNLVDYHRHRLLPQQEPFDLKYRLYAVVSHSGQLSGGHYVAYARNPSGAWLCYNDSMCRELSARPAPPIDPASAYLLFYERQGLDYESYLPDIAGREPVVKDTESLDPDESELRKMCTIM